MNGKWITLFYEGGSKASQTLDENGNIAIEPEQGKRVTRVVVSDEPESDVMKSFADRLTSGEPDK